MKSTRWIALVLHVAFAAMVATAATAHASTEMDDADLAYDTQHYAEALRLYEAAAAKGDLRAQEIAGLMHLYGDAMYGSGVKRDKAQAAKWLRMADEQGSEMARRLLPRLELAATR